MKKVLLIIPYIPYPLTSGGNQAFFHMIEHIRHEMAVSILLYQKTEAQEKDVKKLKELWGNVDFFVFKEIAKEPEARNPLYYKWLKKTQTSIARKIRRQLPVAAPNDMVRNRSTLFMSVFEPLQTRYAEYVADVSRRGFDIIQVEFYELISLCYLLPEDVQTVFVHHELRYVRNENEMALFDGVKEEERMLFRIAKDYERAALLNYKHIIVLTEIDRSILANFIGREERLYSSPAVIQVESKGKSEFVYATHRLTFIGSEGHFPNLDAVRWFCQEVAPHLRNLGFKFVFQVIGQWRSMYIKELSALCPELEFVGYVEDLQDYLKGSIAVVPIRIGSGMRMKILDAVFANTPFVTTSKGVEGIDFRNGEECFIADKAIDFATAIVNLFGDEVLQEKMTHQALQSLQELYNPQKMLDRRLAIYHQILAKE